VAAGTPKQKKQIDQEEEAFASLYEKPGRIRGYFKASVAA
jgi:hypothetical protein